MYDTYDEKAKPLIVTIDDDPISLNTILNSLKFHYEVRPFSSGGTALRFLASMQAALILLDCKMPGMDGFEVLEFLQRDIGTRDIPVLFLTLLEESDSEVLALERGAADYLRKPIAPKVLLTRVRQQLELQSYRKRMELLVEEKTRNLTQALRQLKSREDTTLNMLARATDMRDHDTGNHIWRTTAFVRLIVEELLADPKEEYILSEDQAKNIIRSSKLHDLGKIATPDQILCKPDKLTEEEFRIVKQHPVQGAKLFDEFLDPRENDMLLAVARDIALYHHERWDGMGYPAGRKGRDIPLAARIVTLADVYDALLSARSYKKAFTHEEARAIILNNAGRHFDPYLVEIFDRIANSFRNILQNTAG